MSEQKTFPLYHPTKTPWWIRLRLLFVPKQRSGHLVFKVWRGVVYVIGEKHE